MSHVREQFRSVLARPICTLAANIFDPLSARIAHMLGYEVCVLSGSAGKAANLAVPDLVLSTMSDVVDHCRRITRSADVSLMVDAEDGFGNAVNVMRTVRKWRRLASQALRSRTMRFPSSSMSQTPAWFLNASKWESSRQRSRREPIRRR
jgi:carboxyvinyl-carboxyphosphonate phosphorylmutase